MILKTYDNGRMAEIVIDPTAKPISADELVRMLIANDVFAAKVVKSNPATGGPGSNAASFSKET
jgi:hypothetical protein